MKTIEFCELLVSLQQSIIHTGEERVTNTIVAFTSRHLGAIVIRPEYRDFEREIVGSAESLSDLETCDVYYSDAFEINTWDDILSGIYEKRQKRIEL
jgi:hypothetical protein